VAARSIACESVVVGPRQSTIGPESNGSPGNATETGFQTVENFQFRIATTP
jgi:hypothetical protein